VLARSVRERATAAPGPASALLQRYRRIDPWAHEYPQRRRYSNPDDPLESTEAAPGETYFVRQEPIDRKYFDNAGLGPNITWSTDPALLVSDDGKMAIEECLDGAEAKSFFATADLVDDANRALTGYVRLRITNRFLVLGSRQLYEVVPVVEAGTAQETRGLAVRSPQRCNEMASFVTRLFSLRTPQADQLWLHVAAAIDKVTHATWHMFSTHYRAELDAAEAALRVPFATRSKTARDDYLAKQAEVRERFFKMSVEYRQQLLAALEEPGRNSRLVPGLGQAIVIWSAATDAEDEAARQQGIQPFPYHYATVVASSGEDYVTIENYARREQSQTQDHEDPLYFFQMYSTSQARPEQSWHRRQAASPEIIGLPVSFQWQRERQDG
jgi:hypothetical protein